MLKATTSDGGPLHFTATVGGLPIYLDNHSIIRLAKGDPSRRHRFIEALHAGADLLFSITNAAELTGPQGRSAETIRSFLDEVGAHWFPVELDPFLVTKREADGLPASEACACMDFVRAFFEARTADYAPGSGKVIDLSEAFFRLGAVMDWLGPQRDVLRTRTEDLDRAMVRQISDHLREFERDPSWLDRSFPTLPFRALAPATFAYVNLVRGLILEAKAYRLKSGDGVDFCHAVIGAAFASFATLDKHWKRRVGLLPRPNLLAKVYYEPELDGLVADLEVALRQLRS